MKKRCKLACLLLALCLLFVACEEKNGPAGAKGIAFTDSAGNEVVLRKAPERVAILLSSFADIWTLAGGKIAVTAADCPDGYCMDRGFCDGGAPIVCLPHKLVIEFMGRQEIDGIIG